MVYQICILALLMAWTASVAAAGPWPREKGQTFLSFQTSWDSPTRDFGSDPNMFHSLYLERGLGRDLTFGIDAGISDVGAGTGFAFLRLPIKTAEPMGRFAYRIGFGLSDASGTSEPLVMAGALWGRGFEHSLGPAWVTMDAQVLALTETGGLVTKLDSTLGVKPTDRWKVMLQVQMGDYPGAEPFVRLAPSVAYELAPGRHIELGGQVGLVGDDRAGARIGTWLKF